METLETLWPWANQMVFGYAWASFNPVTPDQTSVPRVFAGVVSMPTRSCASSPPPPAKQTLLTLPKAFAVPEATEVQPGEGGLHHTQKSLSDERIVRAFREEYKRTIFSILWRVPLYAIRR